MSLLGYCSSHIHKSDLADAHFRFSRTSFSVDEDAGLLSGSITLDTSGQIDQEILVVVQTVAGTATGKYMHALDYFISIYLLYYFTDCKHFMSSILQYHYHALFNALAISIYTLL